MTIPEDASAEQVLDCLADQLHAMSPQLQQAGRYIIDHPMEVGVNSMRQLAELSGVTPNTLTRLTRLLGFESYQTFQNMFRDAVRQHTRAIPDRARWLQSIGSGSPHALIVSQMASALLLNLEQLFSGIDVGELEATARLIASARTAYVVGVRGSYSLAHNFHYVARMALPGIQLVPRQASTPLDDILAIGADDVVVAITLAPYARETVEAAQFAAERGAAVVAVTDSRGSPVARVARHLFVAPSGTPQYFNSIVAAGAVLETLLAMIVVTGDQRMLTSIRLYDQMRRERSAYWDGSKAE